MSFVPSTAPPPAAAVARDPMFRHTVDLVITVTMITAAVVVILYALLGPICRRRRRISVVSSGSDVSHSPGGSPDGHLDRRTAVPENALLIDRLPLVTLGAAPASPKDCTVCIATLAAGEEIRLLPACSHAFHKACVDPWLRATPTCPLCRVSIALLPQSNSEERSFRVEVRTVSGRRDNAEGKENGSGTVRSHSLGSELEFVGDEEVEAVVAGVMGRTVPEVSPEVVGVRSWLMDYVDGMSSAASTLYSSFWWSERDDGGGEEPAAGGDLEGNVVAGSLNA